MKAKFIAGGTNILDLMKEGVENPTEFVDISRLNLTQIRRRQMASRSELWRKMSTRRIIL